MFVYIYTLFHNKSITSNTFFKNLQKPSLYTVSESGESFISFGKQEEIITLREHSFHVTIKRSHITPF